MVGSSAEASRYSLPLASFREDTEVRRQGGFIFDVEFSGCPMFPWSMTKK